MKQISGLMWLKGKNDDRNEIKKGKISFLADENKSRIHLCLIGYSDLKRFIRYGAVKIPIPSRILPCSCSR